IYGRLPFHCRKACATISSECPVPYTAAVSIQFTPSSSARKIAATESASSCWPQANSQPEPPMAQAPNPTGVSCKSEFPSLRSFIALPDAGRSHYSSTLCWMRLAREKLELAGSAGCLGRRTDRAGIEAHRPGSVRRGCRLLIRWEVRCERAILRQKRTRRRDRIPSRRLAPCDKFFFSDALRTSRGRRRRAGRLSERAAAGFLLP